MPVILTAVSVYLMYTELKKPAVGTNFYLGILYIVFAIAYYYYMLFRMKNLGKTLLKSLGENKSFDMDITSTAVTTKLASSTTTTDWNAFGKAITSKNIVLLYQQNNTFSMFEKSFFTNDDDFSAFKDLVIQNIQQTIQHN